MTPGALAARLVEIELGVPARALRFAAGGFRAPRAEGFAYDGSGTAPVVVLASAVLVGVEALAFDVLFSRVPVARAASDVVHLYAVLWLVAAAHAFRRDVHRVDRDSATLRTLFFRSCVVPRSAIAAVEEAARPPRGAVRLGLGRRWLRITLREPAVVRDLVRDRLADEIFVAADDSSALARALTA